MYVVSILSFSLFHEINFRTPHTYALKKYLFLFPILPIYSQIHRPINWFHMRISWSPYNCLTCLFIFHSLLLTEIKISGARNCLQLFDVLQSYSGTKQNAEETTWSTEPWPSKTFSSSANLTKWNSCWFWQVKSQPSIHNRRRQILSNKSSYPYDNTSLLMNNIRYRIY